MPKGVLLNFPRENIQKIWIIPNILHIQEHMANKIDPEHYQSNTNLEAIDVIEAFDLNFHRGNIVKYVLRAGKKTERGYENKEKQLEDLKKSKWYLERLIKNVEEG
jgi:hypothetical protein